MKLVELWCILNLASRGAPYQHVDECCPNDLVPMASLGAAFRSGLTKVCSTINASNPPRCSGCLVGGRAGSGITEEQCAGTCNQLSACTHYQFERVVEHEVVFDGLGIACLYNCLLPSSARHIQCDCGHCKLYSGHSMSSSPSQLGVAQPFAPRLCHNISEFLGKCVRDSTVCMQKTRLPAPDDRASPPHPHITTGLSTTKSGPTSPATRLDSKAAPCSTFATHVLIALCGGILVLNAVGIALLGLNRRKLSVAKKSQSPEDLVQRDAGAAQTSYAAVAGPDTYNIALYEEPTPQYDNVPFNAMHEHGSTRL